MGASDAYAKFEWKEISTGVWQRDIDEVEHFYAALKQLFAGSGRMFYAITGHVVLNTPVPEGVKADEFAARLDAALRQAWLHIRHDYPTIASRVHLDESGVPKKTYNAFPVGDAAAEAIEEWLKTTFKPVETTATGVEWCDRDPPAPQVPTLFVLTPPLAEDATTIRRDVVLRSPHDILDGMGTMALFNTLLKHAAGILESVEPVALPVFGEEHVRLSPPLRVAAQIPAELTPEEEAALGAIIQGNLGAWVAGKEIAVLPYKPGNEVPGVHHRASLLLSEAETTEILKKAKALGLTATHAFHAAIAIVSRDLQPRKEAAREVRHLNYTLLSERVKCLPPYNTAEHAVTDYHSIAEQSVIVDLVVPAVGEEVTLEQHIEEFKKVGEIIKGYYVNPRNDPDHLKRIPGYWKSNFVPFVPVSPPTPPPPQPAPWASLSSIGLIDSVLDAKHGPIEVQHPWVTSERLDNGLGVFLSTFQGRLELSSTWNEAWHEKEKVDDFLQRCKEVVVRALEVKA
ncbi:hypothetical protein Poli38472_011570 [Pythium oligandrum]|uniref:Alcohol acetyltransferase n=1 Tax=Pythium oligandrum TaxID=41045 RepID=A0A8K1CK19_PYTOL|nr:hypothetical protein Poli38472_011570 [Pythium oligandrum]|eukprot:TMW64690.1 hypothetical protein Poli38472_011570 [Pythium oligandrum]